MHIFVPLPSSNKHQIKAVLYTDDSSSGKEIVSGNHGGENEITANNNTTKEACENNEVSAVFTLYNVITMIIIILLPHVHVHNPYISII